MRFRRRRTQPAPCPECGGPTSLAGRFCRGCGWDADLEGSPDAHLDGVDLPGGWGPAVDATVPRSGGKRVFLLVAAVLALASFVWAFVL